MLPIERILDCGLFVAGARGAFVCLCDHQTQIIETTPSSRYRSYLLRARLELGPERSGYAGHFS